MNSKHRAFYLSDEIHNMICEIVIYEIKQRHYPISKSQIIAELVMEKYENIKDLINNE